MSNTETQIKTAPISPEMWKRLEGEMEMTFVGLEFMYKGHKLSVERAKKSESKTCLLVYIDGVIKGEWGNFVNKIPEDAPSILQEVWKTSRMSCWKPAEIKKIEKVYGKRAAKKRFPDLHDKLTYIHPEFSKASVLCRQFKKLKGIEVVL